MKLVSYSLGKQQGFGVVVGAGIVSAQGRLRASSLQEALANGLDQELAELERLRPDVGLEEVQLLPPVLQPQKILCAGINYHAHLKEVGAEPPRVPLLFTRFANSHVGHGQPMVRSRVSDCFDYEGELAVVIGKRARHVPEARAFDVVAGYACYNEGTMRDWQSHTSQVTPGKNFPASGAFGPWIVTRASIPDPTRLKLTTRLNGQVVQEGSISDLVFDIPKLIAYCSSFTELLPGDVICTGTTSGVGAFRKPPLWMKPGDVVEVEISEIGTLRNPIVAGE